MRKRLILLLGCYAAFYYLVHILYDMPNIVHGSPQFSLLPESPANWAKRIGDMVFYSFFVLTPYLALYRWYPRKRIFKCIAVTGSILLFTFLFRYASNYQINRYHIRLQNFFLNNILFILVFTVFGTVFYFVRYAYYKELQQKELELQNRNSELSFLRSQINPHFLFNSLNNIYSLVYQGSDKALPAIAGLSSLLRYMLYDTKSTVPLQQEMDYIRQYIDLQKLRYEDPVLVDLRVDGDLQRHQIPPLLLIPFVENAFKHGELTREGGGLAVSVVANGRKTIFSCSNKKGKQQKDSGGGIGIENVRRRLSLLYPENHVLKINETEDMFTVNLELTHEDQVRDRR